MAAIELSLDDIIKKNLVKTNLPRGRNNARKHLVSTNKASESYVKSNNVSNFQKPRIQNLRNRIGNQRPIGDARFKIIQKKRQKITDARDKLGEIAKQTDARLRIEKLRHERFDPTTAKFLVQNPGGLGTSFQNRIGLRIKNNLFKDDVEEMEFDDDIQFSGRGFSESNVFNRTARQGQDQFVYRTVENELVKPIRNQWSNFQQISPILIDDDDDDDEEDDYISRLSKRNLYSDGGRWNQDDSSIVVTKTLKPTKKAGILKMSPNNFDRNPYTIVRESSSSPPPVKAGKTLNERFCVDMNATDRRLSEKISKLSSANIKQEQPEVGHRIVVSNLVSSVTHRDVKELFGDIGKLLSSKVVRPGTAEVVYKSREDAVKAVAVYHDRHLDGQPMKCLLVNNPATVTNIASRSGVKKGKSNVELDLNAFRKALHKNPVL